MSEFYSGMKGPVAISKLNALWDLAGNVSEAIDAAALAEVAAAEAATSAANAATSASAAATSVGSIGTAVTTATTKAGEAATSAANAATSASAAATSAGSIETAATTATTKAGEAATSAATATTKAGEAQNWATQLVTPVSGGDYSAKYWAQQAAASISGSLVYRGSWDASLGSYPGGAALGDYYKVAVSGTVSSTEYSINDSIIYNGTSWDKIDNSEAFVSIVNIDGGTIDGTVIGSAEAAEGNFTNINITGTVTGITATMVGLSNVTNTSDADKPVSTAQATAIGLKQDALVSGTNLKTINGETLLGSGNVIIAGSTVSLTGNLSPYVTQASVLTITNYDSATAYTVSATGGTVSRTNETITYTAGATAGAYALTVNGRNVSIVVQAASVAAPTITSPTAGQTGLAQAPTFTTNAFASIGIADTHLNSDHEVRTGPNGTGTLIASSYADTVNKTAWTMPGNLLATATSYCYRTLHRGNTLGASGWSEVNFTTAATFGGLIGTQGGQGFGVGVCVNSSRLTALGLAAMTGTTDKAHANYGNYQHSNGGISVYRPKFFYRIGHASSPRFATYGANAVDIVGIDTFANEAAANAAGYAMSRSFKNAGVEVDGYFRDKYLASKDGTTSCKSIANADPISLTTHASYNPSSTMTGCTGIVADAVVISRARGAGWNADFFPMAFDSAIIALAHGQASTSPTYCAWYDAGGTTNFPKGCNNGSLADENDATVTYTASYSIKPKTRANANFAKTTDNGQECGIADVNGSMWQVMIGLTMAGTSGANATVITTGNAYLLKTSADFGALTGGFGGTHDAWGTTSSLTTDFDLITGFEPWLGTTGSIYFGNGSNAVFSNATSGTDHLRTCAGIPLLTGTNATGTSQFGNDYCYQYGCANQVPVASGNWANGAFAGVFYRIFTQSRSSDDVTFGFRACAY